jgi:hypothetical protein
MLVTTSMLKINTLRKSPVKLTRRMNEHVFTLSGKFRSLKSSADGRRVA